MGFSGAHGIKALMAMQRVLTPQNRVRFLVVPLLPARASREGEHEGKGSRRPLVADSGDMRGRIRNKQAAAGGSYRNSIES